MNKDDQTKTERFIMFVVEKYQTKLRMLDTTFSTKKQVDVDYLASGFCYPYTETNILYSQDFQNDFIKNLKTKKQLERMIVHEILHQLTDPLYAKAISRHVSKNEILDERERLTDRIATIVCELAWQANEK